MRTSTLTRIGGLLASAVLLVGAGSLPPAAADTRVTATDGVNIRSGPSTTAAVVGGLRRGQTVTAVKRSSNWTTIKYSGSRAYIASRYLKAGTRLPARARSAASTSKVTTSTINLRSGPGLSNRVVRVLRGGTRVNLTGAFSRGFAQVSAGGSRGWVSNRYLAGSTSKLPSVTGVRYATTQLLIRSSSGTKFAVIDKVPRGTKLGITGVRQNGRSQVIYRGAARWVTTKYLSTRRTSTARTPTYAVERGLSARAIALHRASRKAWPGVKTYYGRRSGPNSDHSRGNALDLMIPRYNTSAGRAYGNKIASWAIANQRRLHITYIIWDQRIWNVSRAREGWRRMADRGGVSANHKDHVHISVR